MRQKTSKEAKGRVQRVQRTGAEDWGQAWELGTEQAMTKVFFLKYAEGRPPGHGGRRIRTDGLPDPR